VHRCRAYPRCATQDTANTLNKQLENTVGRTDRILYGQYRNNRRNTTCIPAPWTDSPLRTDDYPSRSTTMHEIYSTRTRWSMHQFALVYHPLRGIKVQSINWIKLADSISASISSWRWRQWSDSLRAYKRNQVINKILVSDLRTSFWPIIISPLHVFIKFIIWT